MRYVAARYEQEQRDRAYRFYVTDALKAIGRLNKRYADMIAEKRSVPNADPEKIKARIKSKLERLGKEKTNESI